jgi:Flp pilus assembly pilin Flp
MKPNLRSAPRLGVAPSLLAVVVAVSLLTGGSAMAAPKASFAVASVTEEFNAICSELTEARLRLERGEVGEGDFGDLVLGLFLRADSLAGIVASLPNGGKGPLGLQRGTAYLIDSLRENWVGIVARNGVSFAEADLALKAAVAWKNSEASAVPIP